RVRFPDNPNIDFSGARAVTELNPRDSENFFANRFLDSRLTHTRNFVEPLGRGGNLYERTQNRHHRCPKDRLKFARRSRQEKKVRRGSAWVDVCLQIKSRRASVFVWKNLRPSRDIR